jgi:hypothetical protein
MAVTGLPGRPAGACRPARRGRCRGLGSGLPCARAYRGGHSGHRASAPAPGGAAGETGLTGGRLTPGVVQVGDTARRPTSPPFAFVHELLRHLEWAGFTAAPRFLGIDRRGREILSYLDGQVPDNLDPGGQTASWPAQPVVHQVDRDCLPSRKRSTPLSWQSLKIANVVCGSAGTGAGTAWQPFLRSSAWGSRRAAAASFADPGGQVVTCSSRRLR